jgi:hypothetical protein
VSIDIMSAPQREDLQHRARFNRFRVIDAQRPDRTVCGDEHATALARLDHAFVLQPRNRLTDHRAAHAELLRQHRLGRQLPDAREGPFVDLLEQLLRDGIAQRAHRNLVEHGCLDACCRVIIQISDVGGIHANPELFEQKWAKLAKQKA